MASVFINAYKIRNILEHIVSGKTEGMRMTCSNG